MRTMRLRILHLPLLAFALLVAKPGHALVIDIDPDNHLAGSDISNVFPGIVLSSWYGEPGAESITGGPVFAMGSNIASTSSNVFGWGSGNNIHDAWGNGTFEYMRADFSDGASTVALDFIANDPDTNAQLLAFNYLGVLIDSALYTDLMNEGDVARLSVSGDIAYIQAYWDEIMRNDNGLLDHLSYEPRDPNNFNQIPNPGTLMLLALGLLGATRCRRGS